MRDKLLNRFLKYVTTDTESKPETGKSPSTKGQLVLAQLIASELDELGLKEISISDKGILTATLPSNSREDIPVIGFIAHLDTSPDFSGKDVKPIITENYDGGDIVLNKEKNRILSPAYFPELKNYVGKTLISSDGTTLLGADDKAGISAIVSAMEYLTLHPEIKHGKIRIAFTPDEEIGAGADFFEVEKFGAQWAYTVDGGALGELEYENFNAAGAKVEIKGISVHPGYAYQKMINASLVAVEFVNMLPENETPAKTKDYEGFYHLLNFQGDVSNAKLEFIIRDHDRTIFEQRKKRFKEAASRINEKYNKELVKVSITDQYFNMKEKIEPVMHIIDIANEAMLQAGVKPDVKPIRGGTDGARLSFMGLPCPNIFTGGHNFHGPFEYLPLESLEKAMETVVNICKITAERK